MSTKPNDAKEERLLGLDLFRNADRKALSHLASAADEVTVSDGHQLIEQGRHHNQVYVISSGAATVTVDGTEVAEIPAGEVVGELSYFVQGPATATVTTKGETALLAIPYNRFDQILDDNPQLVRCILGELAGRLRTADTKLG